MSFLRTLFGSPKRQHVLQSALPLSLFLISSCQQHSVDGNESALTTVYMNRMRGPSEHLSTETNAMLRCERPSRRWLFLLFCAAWVALRVDALSFYGRVGPSSEANYLSSKFSFTQGTISFRSLAQGYSHVDGSTCVVSCSLLRWDENLNTLPARKSFLIMGKGDGKKKRKKKSSPVSSAATPLPQPAPQRVSTDINVPVRKQIMYGQMRKEAAKQTGTSFRQKKVQRTKYRRTWGACAIRSLMYFFVLISNFLLSIIVIRR